MLASVVFESIRLLQQKNPRSAWKGGEGQSQIIHFTQELSGRLKLKKGGLK
jgi:hypothetical protein